MTYKIFIDGEEGTTGLQIRERIAKRHNVELLHIESGKRKDADERKKRINEADFVFLCLPDEAAREAVNLCENPRTRILDSSTAHRVASGWDYGFPELSETHRKKIAKSKRVAVPGCYASGFASLVFPLVQHGIIACDYPLACYAVSGFSGAGKKGILQYEARQAEICAGADLQSQNSANKNSASANSQSSDSTAANAQKSSAQSLASPRLYALTQMHKHLAEMKAVSHLAYEPIFSPYICNFFSGMSVTVPLHARLLSKKVSLENLHDIFAEHYAGAHFIHVAELQGADVLDSPFISADALSGTNQMQIFICGNSERITLTSRFDNLGKGASGAAMQCMNIMTGTDEATGLD